MKRGNTDITLRLKGKVHKLLFCLLGKISENLTISKIILYF